MPAFLPKSSFQVRPRLAVEIRPEGVYGGRANDAGGTLAQVARAELPAGAIAPSLRAGNMIDRAAVIAALRQVLGQLQAGKLRDVSVIVPDLAVRVVLLDFDSLPSDVEDALPVVRFRLAKLLPFPAEAAQVSYQIMSERGRQLQVLAVAMPYEVLAEYESVVREAGFEPGAVVPSTLAVASAIDDAAQTAALFVNANPASLTTAILRRGEILLHRTLELQAGTPALQETYLPDIGVLPASVETNANSLEYGADDPSGAATDEGPVVEEFVSLRATAEEEQQRMALEVLQAISVAAAYYEDSLAAPAEAVWTAGSLTAAEMGELLAGTGLVTREIMQPADVLGTATVPVPHGLLAGLRGALRS